MGQNGIPVEWSIVLAVVALLFGGGTGIVWAIRRDIREGRQAPTLEAQQRLLNDQATAELAAALRDAQRDALADMRQIVADARSEVVHAREEAAKAKAEAQKSHEQAELAKSEAMSAKQQAAALSDRFAKFRMRVEDLLRQNSISIPDWWHEPF